MAYRFKARSTTPGDWNFVAGSLGFLPAVSSVLDGTDRGDGLLGTLDVSGGGTFPDPAYVHLDAGDYGPTGTEYTPELSLFSGWTEFQTPAAATDCWPIQVAAAVATEINRASTGGELSKTFTAVFSFGSEITRLEDVNANSLTVDVLPSMQQDWNHRAGSVYRHDVRIKVGIRRRIATSDRTETGAVDAADVKGYVNLLYEIINLFAAGRNLTDVPGAAWNSAQKPAVQLYDETQLKSGLYVGWTHLPFLVHERAA